MRYFEQLEVMPINLTCVMIGWMVSGMLVLEEGKYYTIKELVWIFASFGICCTGIRVLMAKIKVRRTQKWRLRASSFEQSYTADDRTDDGFSRQSSPIHVKGNNFDLSRARI